MARSGISVDAKSLRKVLARFETMPKKWQKGATKAAARAGATVIKKAAQSMAPSCIKPTIRVVYRRQIGFKTILSISAGEGGFGDKGINITKGNAGKTAAYINALASGACKPAMWYEFGTYGNRDYQGTEPYSPRTLSQKRYASGRSDSPFWNLEDPSKRDIFWTDQRPFMRPAVTAPGVEKAMAKKLNQYISKKGF